MVGDEPLYGGLKCLRIACRLLRVPLARRARVRVIAGQPFDRIAAEPFVAFVRGLVMAGVAAGMPGAAIG